MNFQNLINCTNFYTKLRFAKRKRSKLAEPEKSRGEIPFKRKRSHSLNQAFILNASCNCVAYETKRHPLYLCNKFKQLSVSKRIETVKFAKIYKSYNCLHSRDSFCKFSNCTICQEHFYTIHNTLLYFDKYITANKFGSSNSETAQFA